jgi:hypothetical protein
MDYGRRGGERKRRKFQLEKNKQKRVLNLYCNLSWPTKLLVHLFGSLQNPIIHFAFLRILFHYIQYLPYLCKIIGSRQ